MTPNFSHSSAVFSSSDFVLDNNATSAPVWANAMAVAFPMPLPAPARQLRISLWITRNQCHFTLKREVVWGNCGIRIIVKNRF